MVLLATDIKDKVLGAVKIQLLERREEIITANARDLAAWQGRDEAMYDRLVVDDKKVSLMIKALEDIIADSDPVGSILYTHTHPNGLKVENRTAPFGTVMIIYESRPDVTIEAAMVAFKSNNKILLKGGKEAVHSNRILVDCWHQALEQNDLSKDWVQLLELQRQETQAFLKNPDRPLDLIVPRGGEGLIAFVKAHAKCPVLISGRGNNFLYVHDDADWDKTISVIVNAKTDKISACNALDKVLINKSMSQLDTRLHQLVSVLRNANVEILIDAEVSEAMGSRDQQGQDLSSEWSEEYLAMKIAIGLVEDRQAAVALVNQHSGGHSAAIMTSSEEEAREFMDSVDAAAVYHLSLIHI